MSVVVKALIMYITIVTRNTIDSVLKTVKIVKMLR
ncbi:hypothetical protein BDCR2A_01813 [Borrelia duttonii CR2A]|uniref:Uncharacterized protein n=1 Tax=Borrelia duttonii CR2A TaxID=1432657 RepID=W6TG32_9SPIR|nr:hypothetical protein BDCR2A_01813 [Borrelia duttonii CR2A]